MTTLAKVEANRLNAGCSTGPRTAAGKLAASRNAVTHGVWTTAPVVPGETADGWAAHRAGVSASLAPVGVLEDVLAERVAGLLWRLGRVTRYETLTIRAAVEDASLPRPRSILDGLSNPGRGDLADDLRAAKRAAAVARRGLARAVLAAEYFAAFAGRPDDEPVPPAVAVEVFDAAVRVAERYDYELPLPKPGGSKLLAALGRCESRAGAVPWTAGLIRAGLAVYAGRLAGAVGAGWFVGKVGRELARAPVAFERDAGQLDRRAAGLARRQRATPGWKAAAALLPPADRADRVARYEGHLNKLLVTTLQELERIQSARATRTGAGPAGG